MKFLEDQFVIVKEKMAFRWTVLTQFMGELLTQDGHGGADALEDGGSEWSADGQAVDEVVQAVTQRDHPGQRTDVRVGRPLQPIAPAAAGGAGPAPAVWALGVLARAERGAPIRGEHVGSKCFTTLVVFST